MDVADATSDSFTYALSILHGYAFSFFPVGTTLFGRIFYELGIPFRLGLEVVFMLATALTIKALFDWPTRNGWAAFLFLLTIFNPNPNELFSYVMSDQVWLVEMLLGSALLVLTYTVSGRRRTLLATASGVALALSSITRITLPPLLLCLGALVLGLILPWLWKLFFPPGTEKRSSLFETLAPMGLIVALILSINLSNCTFNALYCGYHGRCFSDCSDYRTFYVTLQSVGDADGEPHYPIDHKRRELIRRAGPVSAAFIDRFEQKQKDTATTCDFQAVSVAAYGLHDVATAWLPLSCYQADDWNTQRAFVNFKAIESEIAEASRRGVITTRAVLPLPDARLGIVARTFPSALGKTFDSLLFEPPVYAYSRGQPEFRNAIITKALNRWEKTYRPNPWREAVEAGLCTVYRYLYGPWLLLVYLALVLAALGLSVHRHGFRVGWPVGIVVREIFNLWFIVLMGWYALFEASGMPVVTRYMVYGNVILPILVVYYGSWVVRLYRAGQATSNS